MASGKLVDSQYCWNLLEAQIASTSAKGTDLILLDGYPRSIDQAKCFVAKVSSLIIVGTLNQWSSGQMFPGSLGP